MTRSSSKRGFLLPNGQPSISPEFIRGARAAADLAHQYDGSSAHEHRLDDCILHKLNIRRGKPRKNKKQLSSPDHVWTCGFSTALAEIYRLLVGGNHPKEICRIAAAAGVDLAALRKAKVSAFDIDALKRAGLP